MGNYSTRLGCTLSFNEESEKDVIKLVEQLQGSRKIGEFVSYLLRIASENPELLDKREDGTSEYGAAVKELARLGVTPIRYQYLQAMNKEVDNLKQKIDEIYSMSLKMYTLAQFGKQLGLEKKSDNMLMASFLAEQELTKICKIFGVGSVQSVFTSNKLESAHDRADDTLKYILETYDGIVNELKNILFKEVEIKAKPLSLEVEPIKLDLQVDGIRVTEQSNQTNSNHQNIVNNVGKPEIDIKDEEDAEIDFGSDEADKVDEVDKTDEADEAGEFSLDNLGMIASFMGID